MRGKEHPIGRVPGIKIKGSPYEHIRTEAYLNKIVLLGIRVGGRLVCVCHENKCNSIAQWVNSIGGKQNRFNGKSM